VLAQGRLRDEAKAVAIDERINKVLDSWDWATVNKVPDRLPLLDRFRKRFDSGFDGWTLLFIQHHLGSTIAMVKGFVESGASVERIWHVDIPYSTVTDVNSVIIGELATAELSLPRFNDPLVDYAAAQMLRTAQVMRQIASTRPERLLVVDDGAYFLRTLIMLSAIGDPAASRLRGACVVEQTTRGHRFLESHGAEIVEHGVRAVSVARTRTKLEFEAPFIGGAVASALLRNRADSWSDVLILGYGAVGRACVAELRRQLPDSKITAVDPHAADFADVDVSHRVNLRSEMPRSGSFDLVLGCTGTNSFTFRDVHLVSDRAVLASASSADVEFGRAAFVEAADRFPDDEIKVIDADNAREHGLHAPLAIQTSASQIVTFLNAGFPVNFDGRHEGLSLMMIQPTRSLLFAAAAQASRQKEAGLRDLDKGVDEWLLQHALATLPK
jgi:S-adenosylhomocysteine hydrolase